MSRAIKVNIVKEIGNKCKTFLSATMTKSEQLPKISSDAIPFVADLSSSTSCAVSTGIPDLFAIRGTCDSFEKPKTTTQRAMLTGETPVDEKEDLTDDVHLGIVEALKDSGYAVNEIKALSSGEKVITISDVLAASNRESSFEFVPRRDHEQNIC